MSAHTLRTRRSPSSSEPGMSQVSQMTVTIFFLLLSTFLRVIEPVRTVAYAPFLNTPLLQHRCGSHRSAGLAGFRRVGAYKVRRPVCLPRAVVIRKCLLPPGMIAVELIPCVADFHGATIVLVLAVELAVIAVEASDHWRFHLPTGATNPINRPLALFQIERP